MLAVAVVSSVYSVLETAVQKGLVSALTQQTRRLRSKCKV